MFYTYVHLAQQIELISVVYVQMYVGIHVCEYNRFAGGEWADGIGKTGPSGQVHRNKVGLTLVAQVHMHAYVHIHRRRCVWAFR